LLLQPLVSRLATEEQAHATADATNASLQQALEVEIPDTAATTRLRVPGAASASFTRVAGSPGTTVDSTTGIVALPDVNAEETIAIAVDGTSRQVTIVRGARAEVGSATGRTLTESELAEIGRALMFALQGAARSTGASVNDGSTRSSDAHNFADWSRSASNAPEGERVRTGTYSPPETSAMASAGTT